MICWPTEQAINSERVLALELKTMFNKFFSSLVELIVSFEVETYNVQILLLFYPLW